MEILGFCFVLGWVLGSLVTMVIMEKTNGR